MALDTGSPGVTSRESVYTILTSGDATVSAGYVGEFEWGPCFIPQLITNENTLRETFGLPNDNNYEHWFTAFSYLAYSNSLYLSRVVKTLTAKNAGIILKDSESTDPFTITIVNPTVMNQFSDTPTIALSEGEKAAFYAKYPGTYGNRLKIATCISTDFATAEIYDGVTFIGEFDYAPKVDEFAIAILLDDKIVEKFICSININGVDDGGNNNYFKQLLGKSSVYISVIDNVTNVNNITSIEAIAFAGGVADVAEESDIISGYSSFQNESEYDVNIILDGANNDEIIQQYIVDNIAEKRQNLVAYLGPKKSHVVNVVSVSTAVTNMTSHVETVLARSSSYAAFFGNYKVINDHVNNKERWVPITADMAGIYARTVITKEPWYSGFGPNYGKMLNVVRLAINPDKDYRTALYKKRVNPIYTDKNDGSLMFGQKTLLSANVPFNRLDVRFLFIYIREAVEKTARYFLGEKNTEFQRRRFVNSITPFLQDVAGREGIETDFYIQCDEENNNAQVRQSGGFIAQFLLKPTFTIEFISLEFTSVGGDVDFSEIVKK